MLLSRPASRGAAFLPGLKAGASSGGLGDDDRFDLASGAAIKQARKTDNPAIEIGHPRCHPFWYSEIVVERTPGIVASDRRVLI